MAAPVLDHSSIHQYDRGGDRDLRTRHPYAANPSTRETRTPNQGANVAGRRRMIVSVLHSCFPTRINERQSLHTPGYSKRRKGFDVDPAVAPERDSFVRLRSAYSFERFVNLPRVAALRILDFGSGQGHLEGNKLYGRVRL
jgi:hypothetical protein